MNSDLALSVTYPPIFSTLVVGLLLAFAFQLTLAIVGIAVGITAVKGVAKQPESSTEQQTTGKIRLAVGVGTLLMTNSVLFIACFLAVKLSLVKSAALGAILGVAIWSGYFLILAWLSTQAMGSLIGAIANTLTVGTRQIFTILRIAFDRKEDSSITNLQQQLDETQIALTALQQDLSQILSEQRVLPENKNNNAASLHLPQLDVKAIGSQVAHLVSSEPGVAAAVAGWIGGILAEERHEHDEETLKSDSKIAIAERVDAQVTEYLRSSPKTALKTTSLKRFLQDVLETVEPNPNQWAVFFDRFAPTVVAQILQERQDLTPGQQEQVVQRFQKACDRLIAEIDKLEAQRQAEAADLWQQLEQFIRDRQQKLTSRNIQRQLKTLAGNSKTELATLQRYLPTFEQDTVQHWLRERQDLSQKQVKKAAKQLEQTWNQFIQPPAVPDLPNGTESDLTFKEGLPRTITNLPSVEETLADYSDPTEQANLNIAHLLTQKLADGLDSTRLSLLQGINQTQEKVAQQITDIKEAAKQQMEETQKAVAIAAWWLFSLVLTSAAASAIAGAIAADRFNWLGVQ